MMKNSLGLLLLFIFFSSLFIYPQQNTFTSIELKEQDYFYCSLNKETIYPEVNLTLSYNNNALIIKGVVKAGIFEAIKVETIVRSPSGAKNIINEWYSQNIGLVKVKIIIEGGGLMGLIRDLLGYGEIDFELKEIRRF